MQGSSEMPEMGWEGKWDLPFQEQPEERLDQARGNHIADVLLCL